MLSRCGWALGTTASNGTRTPPLCNKPPTTDLILHLTTSSSHWRHSQPYLNNSSKNLVTYRLINWYLDGRIGILAVCTPNYWSTASNGQNFDIALCLRIRASNSPFFQTPLVQPILEVFLLEVHTVQNIESGEENHYDFRWTTQQNRKLRDVKSISC